jgi:tRNA wybutosine-synthesizing protein 4
VVNHQGQTWVVGGIIKNEILTESSGFALIDSQFQVSRAFLSKTPSSIPLPLLIGSSLVSMGHSLLVMGGSAVCFSFGTSWNKGCYTLRVVGGAGKDGVQSPVEAPTTWTFQHTVAAARPTGLTAEMPLPATANSIGSVPRAKVGSATHFDQILRLAKPVIVEGLDLGPCTELWQSDYLKENVGADREVSFT